MINQTHLMMMPMIIKFKAYLENFNCNKINKKMVKIGPIKFKNSKHQKTSNKESLKICLKNSMPKKRTIKKMTSLLSNNKVIKMTFCSKKITMPSLANKNNKQSMSKSSNNSNNNM